MSRSQQAVGRRVQAPQLRTAQAGAYANLGVLYETRGDLARASEYWIKARDIFSQIPMLHMVEKVQKWLDESDAIRSKK